MLKQDPMITLNDLKEKCSEFEKREGRVGFYNLALEIRDTYPLQAAIIILATWNIGRFRFLASNPENLIELKEALNNCKPFFDKLNSREFKTATLVS